MGTVTVYNINRSYAAVPSYIVISSAVTDVRMMGVYLLYTWSSVVLLQPQTVEPQVSASDGADQDAAAAG